MCVLQDFCPCENQCNNQMFTKKQYAKLAVVSSSCWRHDLVLA
jgi:hypothetical protein